MKTAPSLLRKQNGQDGGRKGIMDILIESINEGRAEDEKFVRLHTTPTMECGDGRWRNLDGTFAGGKKND